jgi:hypothetical protein
MMKRGVPQGSVLGPMLLTLYVCPIEDIVRSFDIDAMFHADDTQIYVILNTTNRSTAIDKLESCAGAIKTCSEENKRVMNDSKAEVVHCFFLIFPVTYLVSCHALPLVVLLFPPRMKHVIWELSLTNTLTLNLIYKIKSYLQFGLSCPSEYWKDPKISRWPYN